MLLCLRESLYLTEATVILLCRTNTDKPQFRGEWTISIHTCMHTCNVDFAIERSFVFLRSRPTVSPLACTLVAWANISRNICYIYRLREPRWLVTRCTNFYRVASFPSYRDRNRRFFQPSFDPSLPAPAWIILLPFSPPFFFFFLFCQ